MAKEFVVKYGKDVYTRNAMTGSALQYLGLRLMPKVIGLASVIGCVVGNKFVQGENLYSYFQCIKDVFDAEDWKWLLDEIIYNVENPIKVGERYLTSEEEINEHFAGDFVRIYIVTLQFAYQNLGEFKMLTENLNGLAKNIADYLKELIELHMTDLEQSLTTYAINKTQKNKTAKSQNK